MFIETTQHTKLTIGGTVVVNAGRLTRLALHGDSVNDLTLTVTDPSAGVIDVFVAKAGGYLDKDFIHPYPGTGGKAVTFTLTVAGGGGGDAYLQHNV